MHLPCKDIGLQLSCFTYALPHLESHPGACLPTCAFSSKTSGRTPALSAVLNYDKRDKSLIFYQKFTFILVLTLNQIATVRPLEQQVVRVVFGARVWRPRNDDDPSNVM